MDNGSSKQKHANQRQLANYLIEEAAGLFFNPCASPRRYRIRHDFSLTWLLLFTDRLITKQSV
jgi:hypothetical protein